MFGVCFTAGTLGLDWSTFKFWIYPFCHLNNLKSLHPILQIRFSFSEVGMILMAYTSLGFCNAITSINVILLLALMWSLFILLYSVS